MNFTFFRRKPFQYNAENHRKMDIRRNADRLTLIYTATLSRFGSGPRRPTAVQARSHLNTQLPNADTIHFLFLVREKGGFVRTLRTPLGYVSVMRRDQPYFIIAFRFKFSILRSRTLPRLVFLSFFFLVFLVFFFFWLTVQSPTHPGRSVIQNAKAIHNLENF